MHSRWGGLISSPPFQNDPPGKGLIVMFYTYHKECSECPCLFDPENNSADVAAFAEMWPNVIYFESDDNHDHNDHAVRVGFMLAWKCSICNRIDITSIDLRKRASNEGL